MQKEKYNDLWIGFSIIAQFYGMAVNTKSLQEQFYLGFRLLFAVAMSITAIPILGRIFMELNYSDTKIASIIISSAAIDDVIGWLLLGLITALVTANFNEQIMLYKIYSLILFALIAYSLGSRVLSSFINIFFLPLFCLYRS